MTLTRHQSWIKRALKWGHYCNSCLSSAGHIFATHCHSKCIFFPSPFPLDALVLQTPFKSKTLSMHLRCFKVIVVHVGTSFASKRILWKMALYRRQWSFHKPPILLDYILQLIEDLHQHNWCTSKTDLSKKDNFAKWQDGVSISRPKIRLLSAFGQKGFRGASLLQGTENGDEVNWNTRTNIIITFTLEAFWQILKSWMA